MGRGEGALDGREDLYAVVAWLGGRGASDRYVELVRDGGELREHEQHLVFGDTLPRGLRIE